MFVKCFITNWKLVLGKKVCLSISTFLSQILFDRTPLTCLVFGASLGDGRYVLRI
jgi:hypothetical protein